MPEANPAPTPVRPTPAPAPTAKSGEVARDQVTLKSTGDVDHDGDQK